MEYKVSVIVPVYKVERYLEKCLKSLLYQSLTETEILVVNDGSPDDSQKIIDRYARLFPQKIVSFQKENGGVAAARNFGIERAHGEYIAFLDGDDFADLDFCQRLYERAVETGADIVASDVRVLFPDGKVREVKSGHENADTREKIKKSLVSFYPVVWNKLYKRTLLEESGVRFSQGIATGEDVDFLYRLLPYAKSVAVEPFAFINYVQREGSVTARPDARILQYLTVWKGLLSFYRENGFWNDCKKELEFACVRYLYATMAKRAAVLPKADFENALREAQGIIRENFPYYRRNGYFYKAGAKGLYLLLFSPRWGFLLRKGEGK